MSNPCVIVMGKMPVPGRVKTRLVPPLSFEQAAALHDAFVHETLSRLRPLRPNPVGRLVLCVDPPEATGEASAHYGDVEVAPQAAGDLGSRLIAAYSDVGKSSSTMFIGCDTPDLPRGHIESALELLRSGTGVVLGPTDDGGFWCLGVAAGLDLEPVLNRVDWSSGREMSQVVRNAAATALPVAIARRWRDIDRPQDLVDLLGRSRVPASDSSAS